MTPTHPEPDGAQKAAEELHTWEYTPTVEVMTAIIRKHLPAAPCPPEKAGDAADTRRLDWLETQAMTWRDVKRGFETDEEMGELVLSWKSFLALRPFIDSAMSSKQAGEGGE